MTSIVPCGLPPLSPAPRSARLPARYWPVSDCETCCDLRRRPLGDDLPAVLARARARGRRGGRRRASCPRRARRRSPCCRGRAGARACRAACGCRAGAGRSTARRGCRARPRGSTRSGSRAGSAAPRRPRASPPRARASGSPTPTLSRNRSRSTISFRIRRAICRSELLSSSSSSQSIASRADLRVYSWMPMPPTFTARLSGRRRAPLHSGHGTDRHVLLDPLARVLRVGLAVAALEARHDALERRHVRAPAPHPVPVGDVDALARRSP